MIALPVCKRSFQVACTIGHGDARTGKVVATSHPYQSHHDSRTYLSLWQQRGKLKQAAHVRVKRVTKVGRSIDLRLTHVRKTYWIAQVKCLSCDSPYYRLYVQARESKSKEVKSRPCEQVCSRTPGWSLSIFYLYVAPHLYKVGRGKNQIIFSLTSDSCG
jgi:hypothetical protein